MKNLSILIIIGILGLSSIIEAQVPDYIITRDEVKYFKKVREGLSSNIIGITEVGREKISADQVLAYSRDGRIFERMPVIEDNRETGRYAFMELLTHRNGLKVYKHITMPYTNDPEEEYLVYTVDGKYVVRFDSKNSPTLNQFFFRMHNVAVK